MRRSYQKFLENRVPEILLACTAILLVFRELGTFPGPWEDDSLFMIVARRLAEGQGYSLPILSISWEHPYILGVGPAVIAPVAAGIRLFGYSTLVARVTMALSVLLAAMAAYGYAYRIAGQTNARWTAALLISLSAFINTGKPVLGEVPSLLWTWMGMAMLERGLRDARWSMACGTALGIAVGTKVTMGLIGPALIAAWIACALLRDRRAVWHCTLIDPPESCTPHPNIRTYIPGQQ